MAAGLPVHSTSRLLRLDADWGLRSQGIEIIERRRLERRAALPRTLTTGILYAYERPGRMVAELLFVACRMFACQACGPYCPTYPTNAAGCPGTSACTGIARHLLT